MELEESDDITEPEGTEGVLQTELDELAKLELEALQLDDEGIERKRLKFNAGVSLRKPKTW